MLGDQLEPAAQDGGTLLGGLLLPGGTGGLGGVDGTAGLGGAHVGHVGDGLAGGRVGDGDGLAAVGIQPLTIDQAAGLQQARVLELHGVSWGVRPFSERWGSLLCYPISGTPPSLGKTRRRAPAAAGHGAGRQQGAVCRGSLGWETPAGMPCARRDCARRDGRFPIGGLQLPWAVSFRSSRCWASCSGESSSPPTW